MVERVDRVPELFEDASGLSKAVGSPKWMEGYRAWKGRKREKLFLHGDEYIKAKIVPFLAQKYGENPTMEQLEIAITRNDFRRLSIEYISQNPLALTSVNILSITKIARMRGLNEIFYALSFPCLEELQEIFTEDVQDPFYQLQRDIKTWQHIARDHLI